MSIQNLFTKEQLESLKNGQPLSGSIRDGVVQAKVFTPTTTTPISGYGSDLKPIIRDEAGEPILQEKVTRPNIDRHNKAAAERALKDLELADAAKAEQEQLNPNNLLATVRVLERKIRKIERQLKEQQQP